MLVVEVVVPTLADLDLLQLVVVDEVDTLLLELITVKMDLLILVVGVVETVPHKMAFPVLTLALVGLVDLVKS
tara:strand:- start:188 stop:406 length:219 start_codon:yes stop_codon:yes gene_type:complete